MNTGAHTESCNERLHGKIKIAMVTDKEWKTHIAHGTSRFSRLLSIGTGL
jgi:hypothetical protein